MSALTVQLEAMRTQDYNTTPGEKTTHRPCAKCWVIHGQYLVHAYVLYNPAIRHVMNSFKPYSQSQLFINNIMPPLMPHLQVWWEHGCNDNLLGTAPVFRQAAKAQHLWTVRNGPGYDMIEITIQCIILFDWLHLSLKYLMVYRDIAHMNDQW